MPAPPPIRRALWLAFAALLLLTRIAGAAYPALSADFDGDGHRDHVIVDHAQPSVVHVWLSSTNATADIHSHAPIVRLVARDLDGDRRSELIANADGGVQVWTRKRHGFHAFRPDRGGDADLARQSRRAFDDGPAESGAAIQWTAGATLALTLAPEPRAPDAPSSLSRVTPDTSLPARVLLAFYGPRPPPTHV